jgi:hypothetical protein
MKKYIKILSKRNSMYLYGFRYMIIWAMTKKIEYCRTIEEAEYILTTTD